MLNHLNVRTTTAYIGEESIGFTTTSARAEWIILGRHHECITLHTAFGRWVQKCKWIEYVHGVSSRVCAYVWFNAAAAVYGRRRPREDRRKSYSAALLCDAGRVRRGPVDGDKYERTIERIEKKIKK